MEGSDLVSSESETDIIIPPASPVPTKEKFDPYANVQSHTPTADMEANEDRDNLTELRTNLGVPRSSNYNGRPMSSGLTSIIMDRSYGLKTFKKGAPLFMCKAFVKRPYFWFGFTLGIQLSIIAVSVILYFAGYTKIFPHNFETHPFVMKRSDVHREYLAWEYRFGSPKIYKRKPATLENDPRNPYVRQRTAEDLFATLIFQKTQGNVLTRENLVAIQALENTIFYERKYQAKYCDFLEDGECLKPLSLIRFFDGTFAAFNPMFNDTDFKDINGILRTAFQTNSTRGFIMMLVGRDFKILSDGSVLSKLTQSFVYINYTNKPKQYMIDVWHTKFQTLTREGLEGMDFWYRNEDMQNQEMFTAVVTDFTWVIASIFFIFCFMWFQTASIFLTFWGIFSTLTSFVTSNFVYNLVFDYQYFGVFQMMTVFVTLGIAADDIFIFCDTWKALQLERFPTLEHRLSACFHNCANSMFVTTLATAVAFFSNAVNPILAVSSFGAYSGIVIIVNYVSVIVFYPNVVLIYHLNVGHMCDCGKRCDETGCRCKQCEPKADNLRSGLSKPSCFESSSSSNDEHKDPAHRLVVRFLSGPYFRLICNCIFQVIVLVLFTAMIAVLSYYLTKLTADEKPPQVFKKSHHSEIFVEKSSTEFYVQDVNKLIKVAIVWGVGAQDVSICHPREFKTQPCQGRTNWKTGFDMNDASVQSSILKFCNTIQTMSTKDLKHLRIRVNPGNNLPSMQCPIQSMHHYLQNEGYVMISPNEKKYSGDLSLSITKKKGRQLMSKNKHIYDMAKVTDDFTRYFETVYAYWVTNGHGRGSQMPTNQALMSPLVVELNDSKDLLLINNSALSSEDYFGTKIGMVGVQVALDISWDRTYYLDGLELFDKWVDFVKKQTSGEAYQTAARNEWHYYHTVSELVYQCYISVAAGAALAWVILVLSSGNYIVGTLATTTILLVVVCVLGAVPLAGWKLGLLEALNTTLVLGLSVDYVVHMGVAYNHSGRKDRKGRVQFALEHMGISVLSGATTTIGSSIFMLFTQIAFFGQFATFMLFTIGFSIVFALTFFMVILVLIGPQGNTGSNKILIRKVRRFMRKNVCGKKRIRNKVNETQTLVMDNVKFPCSNDTQGSVDVFGANRYQDGIQPGDKPDSLKSRREKTPSPISKKGRD